MIDDLIGKGFEYGAEGPDYYDCWTLSREVLLRQGIILPKWDSVIEVEARNNLINSALSKFILIKEPIPYCIVLFKLHPKYTTHIGVVLDNCKTFIHVMKLRMVCVERLSLWRHKTQGFYVYNESSNNTKSI